MEIYLTETAPSPSGEEVVCKMTLRDGRNVQRVKGEIAADFFFGLGIPSETRVETPITREKFSEIEYAMKKTDAVKIGINLLSFAPNTKRALCEKLKMRGVGREVAADAVDFLADCGYINEYEMALTLIDDMANRRLYGRMRIKNELFAKGFSPDAASRAVEESDVDFVGVCAERIKKTVGVSVFSEREGRMKAVSSIMRYGFTTDEIKEALAQINNET